MKIKFNWQVISGESLDSTSRAMVIGGWLVSYSRTLMFLGENENGSVSETMVFVPDPNHEWEIE
jgi:hypothetical protein